VVLVDWAVEALAVTEEVQVLLVWPAQTDLVEVEVDVALILLVEVCVVVTVL
jgi:hypothetical protein